MIDRTSPRCRRAIARLVALAALALNMALIAALTSAAALAATAAPAPPALPAIAPEILARSVVNEGNVSRLQAALAKGRRGEPVSVVVIGGSITAGSLASTTAKSYAGLLSQWWKATFPTSKIKFTNAGVGATGSAYAALRAERDVAKYKPDFVLVEFSVNEFDSASSRTLEGLVRQLLSLDTKPAVMLLLTMMEHGESAQEWHEAVGRYYDLPIVSVKNALWPELAAGRLNWHDLWQDDIHPNDAGHPYLAEFVTSFIGGVLAKLPADADIKAPGPLPVPLYTDWLQYVTLAEGKAIPATTQSGWTASSLGWRSKVPGSVIEIPVTGREVYLMLSHLNGAAGIAKVQVDGGEPTYIDCWMEATWGTWKRLDMVATNLAPGAHTIRVEVAGDKDPASRGFDVVINAVGSAGTQP